jgi:hypothetical protein
VTAAEDILAGRLGALRVIVQTGFANAPEQVQGFVLRVLGAADEPPGLPTLSLDECLDAARFGGYPSLARAGYSLVVTARASLEVEAAGTFLHAVDRQRERSVHSQAELAGDAIALLGLADGLRALRQLSLLPEAVERACLWVRGLLDQHGTSDPRLGRARLLAGDLLDGQSRLGRQLAQSADLRVAALDLCLWRTWPDALRVLEHPDTTARRELFRRLLRQPLPAKGEPLHAASWLSALDVLTGEFAAAAVPDAHHVTRILAATQGSFRRWRWEEKSTRKGVQPARWLIEKEADVQAFLLAVLYPYFGKQLEDEQYLSGFGLRQGRFDFAITSLGLIVEVKVLRTAADIKELEAQIADDLSIYFKPSNPFESMIVYIYDDRDAPEPENYPAIRDAIRRRSERIVDVVLVQRPSMIPDRARRAAA